MILLVLGPLPDNPFLGTTCARARNSAEVLASRGFSTVSTGTQRRYTCSCECLPLLLDNFPYLKARRLALRRFLALIQFFIGLFNDQHLRPAVRISHSPTMASGILHPTIGPHDGHMRRRDFSTLLGAARGNRAAACVPREDQSSCALYHLPLPASAKYARLASNADH